MREGLLLFGLLWLVGCSTKPYIVESTDLSLIKSQQVHVVSHGWHTGLVVPAEIITQQIPQLKQRFDGYPYIEFGWGDKGFYQSNEITTGLTLQAIFWPSESVVHAVAVPRPPSVYFPNSEVLSICLTSDQYAKLIAFIENSFYRNENSEITPLKNGIYGNSQFYKGEGDYYLFNTCNKWTAKGLSSADMEINTTFKLTAGSIMDYLEKHSDGNRVCQ